jgi:hypothetical protein
LGAPVDFDPFADDDSAAQVPNELMAAHDQQDLVRREPLQQAHDAQSAPEPGGRLDRTFKHALGTMEDIYRPALEGGGGVLGSLSGVPAGPYGMVAGGGLGYAIGKKAADWLDIYRGVKEPYESAGEVWKETLLQDIPEGVTLEAGGMLAGAALVPVMKGGKWALKKITTDPIKYLFSKKWAQDQASKILVAHMGDNVIYAANREHAEQILKEFPGLKFTPAEMAADPSLLALQRSQARSEGPAKNLTKEMEAQNDAVLKDAYQKQFGGQEGIDDVIGALQAEQEALKTGAYSAAATARRKAIDLGQVGPDVTGTQLLDAIDTAKMPVKKTMDELESMIPDYRMEFKETKAAIGDILSSKKLSEKQRIAVERARDSIENIIETQGPSTHTAFAARRTLNDEIEAAFAQGKDSQGQALLKVKDGLLKDLQSVTYAARSGKVMEAGGKPIYPDELAQRLEVGARQLAQMKAAPEQLDALAMYQKLAQDDPLTAGAYMQQMKESKKDWASRIAEKYKGIYGDPIYKADPAQAKRIADLEAAQAEIQSALATASPGQDVASLMRAYNEYASSQYFGKFDKGAVKRITARGSERAGTSTALENMAGKLKTPSGAMDLINSIGKEKAAAIMKGSYAYDLYKMTKGYEKLSSDQLNGWIAQNRQALDRYGLTDQFKDLGKSVKMAEAAADAAKDFETAAVKNLLGADPDQAIGKAISGSAPAKRILELMAKTKGNPAALAGLQHAMGDHIMGKIVTARNTIAQNPAVSVAKFKAITSKYDSALKALYKDSPEKLKSLYQMRDAYEIMSRSVASSLGGGSDTMENVFTEMFKKGAGKVLPRAVGWIPALFERFGKYNAQQIEGILTRALFDPNYADELVRIAGAKKMPSTVSPYPSPKNVDQRIQRLIRNNVIDLQTYRAQAQKAAQVGAAGAAMAAPVPEQMQDIPDKIEEYIFQNGELRPKGAMQ